MSDLDERRKDMKVAVLIPAHCHPETLFLTIGTLLRHKSPDYEMTLAVSLHENYQDYNPDGRSQIYEMLGDHAIIVEIPEIDWHEWSIMRYSKMHAKSIVALLGTVPDDADYVAIFDHDLYFHEDFITWATQDPNDMFCTMLTERMEPELVKTEDGYELKFMPKASVWHMLLSARMAAMCRAMPETVFPVEGDTVYDTMSLAFEKTQEWGMTRRVVSIAEMEKVVRHEWSMSFNFGKRTNPEYDAKVARLKERFKREFPDGIAGQIKEKICQNRRLRENEELMET